MPDLKSILTGKETLMTERQIVTAKPNVTECFLCPTQAAVMFYDGKDLLPVCGECFQILTKE